MTDGGAKELAGSLFDEEVERAILASFVAHEGQYRKGSTRSPYVTHPFHVALVLARHGASTRVLVGALLHDAVEDSDEWDLARVEREFDADVAELVEELTEDKRLSWAERKAAWVAAAETMSDDAIQVKCADKLHNLHSLAADLEEEDDHDLVWLKFTGGRERTVEHAKELVEALWRRAPRGLGEELLAALRRFEAAVENPGAGPSQ